MSSNTATRPASNRSLADPDLPRLPIQDCNTAEPPKLVVWLNYITRASVSTLSEPHRRCSICTRPMCDYDYLRKKQIMSGREATRRPLLTPKAPTILPEDSSTAASSNSTAISPPPRISSARSGNESNMQRLSAAIAQINHTCDRVLPIQCEFPIKILTPGCGHYIGHSCLEQWILVGRRQCPVCRIVWFRKARNRRQALMESYQYRTPACMLGLGDVELDKSYQPTGPIRALPSWGARNTEEEEVDTNDEEDEEEDIDNDEDEEDDSNRS